MQRAWAQVSPCHLILLLSHLAPLAQSQKTATISFFPSWSPLLTLVCPHGLEGWFIRVFSAEVTSHLQVELSETNTAAQQHIPNYWKWLSICFGQFCSLHMNPLGSAGMLKCCLSSGPRAQSAQLVVGYSAISPSSLLKPAHIGSEHSEKSSLLAGECICSSFKHTNLLHNILLQLKLQKVLENCYLPGFC